MADQNVANLNRQMLAINTKLDNLRPEYERLSQMMDTLIDMGLDEPNQDTFSLEDMNFWERCDGKDYFIILTLICLL